LSFFASAGITIFILILFLGVFLNLFGLPGTVVIFFDVLLYAIFTGFGNIGLKIILILLFSAVIAEIIEFFLVADDIHQPVFSKKSFSGALSGAVLGAFLLTPFLWGPGAWIGFFLGGLIGLLTTEIIRQYQLKPPHRTIKRTMLTMTGKNLIKGFISLCMIAFSLSNIYS
jgi:hypothetical protein